MGTISQATLLPRAGVRLWSCAIGWAAMLGTGCATPLATDTFVRTFVAREQGIADVCTELRTGACAEHSDSRLCRARASDEAYTVALLFETLTSIRASTDAAWERVRAACEQRGRDRDPQRCAAHLAEWYNTQPSSTAHAWLASLLELGAVSRPDRPVDAQDILRASHGMDYSGATVAALIAFGDAIDDSIRDLAAQLGPVKSLAGWLFRSASADLIAAVVKSGIDELEANGRLTVHSLARAACAAYQLPTTRSDMANTLLRRTILRLSERRPWEAALKADYQKALDCTGRADTCSAAADAWLAHDERLRPQRDEFIWDASEEFKALDYAGCRQRVLSECEVSACESAHCQSCLEYADRECMGFVAERRSCRAGDDTCAAAGSLSATAQEVAARYTSEITRACVQEATCSVLLVNARVGSTFYAGPSLAGIEESLRRIDRKIPPKLEESLRAISERIDAVGGAASNPAAADAKPLADELAALRRDFERVRLSQSLALAAAAKGKACMDEVQHVLASHEVVGAELQGWLELPGLPAEGDAASADRPLALENLGALRGFRVRLGDKVASFAACGADTNADSKAFARSLAPRLLRLLDDQVQLELEIIGHTDEERPSPSCEISSNRELGMRRARAFLRELSSALGMPEPRADIAELSLRSGSTLKLVARSSGDLVPVRAMTPEEVQAVRDKERILRENKLQERRDKVATFWKCVRASASCPDAALGQQIAQLRSHQVTQRKLLRDADEYAAAAVAIERYNESNRRIELRFESAGRFDPSACIAGDAR